MRKLFKTSVAAALTLAASTAVADFPTDKEITFVIPYSAGGGFDTIVRTFTPALEADLGTSVVPKNIKGASGTRGGQAVARADADGYTIGIFNIPGLTVSQVMDRDIGFDLGKITWIANLASVKYAIAVKSDSEVNSLKDLCDLDRPIKLSDTGKDSTSSITSVIAFDIIGCPITNVTGYDGSNDTMIAVMRGEVDATLKPVSSLGKYVKSGDLRMIVTLSDESLVEGVPTTTELGYPELARFGLNRVVGGPEGMSADVVARLQDGFKAAIESESVTAWAASSRTTLNFMNAEDTGAMMDTLSNFYLQYKPLLEAK
ncbi:MAG: tripartite tricarboxylate transporter substrate binding protein [Gammaproteobacteria bacterium]|nr:tripartite tricarboxylate transporter substrate binding protein [Gammaproteobacteria bacterium]